MMSAPVEVIKNTRNVVCLMGKLEGITLSLELAISNIMKTSLFNWELILSKKWGYVHTRPRKN